MLHLQWWRYGFYIFFFFFKHLLLLLLLLFPSGFRNRSGSNRITETLVKRTPRLCEKAGRFGKSPSNAGETAATMDRVADVASGRRRARATVAAASSSSVGGGRGVSGERVSQSHGNCRVTQSARVFRHARNARC